MECDPKGKCPKCGYQNGAGVERCVRCRSIIHVPQGCTGACSKCLLEVKPKAAVPKA
jgi:hypothetical protein